MRRSLLLLLATAAVLAAIPASALAKTVRLGAGDDGSRVVLAPGDRVVVRLEANETTPYHWVPGRGLDSSVVRITRDAYVTPKPKPGAPPLVGAGGTQVYVLRAVAKGHTRFRTRYRYVGRHPKAVRTFTLRLRVR